VPNRFDPNPYTGKPMYYKDNPEAITKRNHSRMWVNGEYIPKSHPLHKAGRYKSLDDVWSHSDIEKTYEGDVYLIMNPAWPEWVKVGKAAIATDRLSNYQTSSPFRDYIIIKSVKTEDRHATETDLLISFEAESIERRGEWFKISKEKAIELLAL
jgi:hypothetical protein